MSALEFEVWAEYARDHGFPGERIEAAAVRSGVYVGACMGGKATERDIAPRTAETADQKRARLRAWIEARTAPAAGEANGGE
jgi:hypothetical protein